MDLTATMDIVKRSDEGLCHLCPGRLLLCGWEQRYVQCPDWIKEEVIRLGRMPSDEPIEVNTYTYRCVDCGHEIQSSKFFDAALNN